MSDFPFLLALVIAVATAVGWEVGKLVAWFLDSLSRKEETPVAVTEGYSDGR